MKIKKLSAVVLVVVALLLISTTTVFARPTLAQFTVDNRSTYPAYIYMNGAGGEYYYLTVAAGTSKTFTVERVKYTYKLVKCNGESSNNSIDLKDGGGIVVPATCEKASPVKNQVLSARPQLGRFTVDNRSTYTAYVYLHGAGGQFYYLTVAAGKSKTFTVDRTTYTYDLNSCGGKLSKNNKIDLSNSGSLVVPAACETASKLTQTLFARPQLGRFTVDNRSTYTAYVYLHGAGGQFYYLTVAAGKSKTFTVDRTTYTYDLNSCGGKLSKNNKIDLSNSGSLVVPAACETASKLTQTLFARPQLGRFTVDNRSTYTAYVYLHGAGGQYYYLTVAAGKSKTFTVDRTTYTYDLNSCGKLAKNKKLDLSNGGSLVVPATCETTTTLTQVRSARPQLARFVVDNNSEKPAYVYLHGAGGQYYYLTVGAEKVETFTVDRTTYTYNLNTCGKLAKNLKIDLTNSGSIGIADNACEP